MPNSYSSRTPITNCAKSKTPFSRLFATEFSSCIAATCQVKRSACQYLRSLHLELIPEAKAKVYLRKAWDYWHDYGHGTTVEYWIKGDAGINVKILGCTLWARRSSSGVLVGPGGFPVRKSIPLTEKTSSEQTETIRSKWKSYLWRFLCFRVVIKGLAQSLRGMIFMLVSPHYSSGLCHYQRIPRWVSIGVNRMKTGS